MPSATVKALWVAGYAAELPDKTPLIPGETVVEVPRGEAEASDNWQVVEPPKPAPKREASEKDGEDS